MTCASSCKTRDHESYGACLRQQGIAAQWLGGVQSSYGEQKRFDAETQRYRAVVRDGLRPDAPTNAAVDRALRAAEKG